jgi:enamine deaminase RidA (YjgF/YER057c/UK114 family)
MSERARVSSGSPFEATVGFSRAVRVGELVFVSGTAPVWPDGSCPDDAFVQAQRCWEIALDALAELGGTPADVVRTRQFITHADVSDEVSRAHAEHFSQLRPASTMVVVAGLLDPRWLIEVEVDAVLG